MGMDGPGACGSRMVGYGVQSVCVVLCVVWWWMGCMDWLV